MRAGPTPAARLYRNIRPRPRTYGGLAPSAGLPPLPGPRHDVAELAGTLHRLGLGASDITVLAGTRDASEGLPCDGPADAPTLARVLAARAASLDEDAALLIHVSGRGGTTPDGTPVLGLSDGTRLPVQDLLAPFAHRRVRSVLTVLDVGFAGDPATSRTLGGALGPTLPLDLGDPILTANGFGAPVPEVRLAGVPRGLLSHALARVLERLPSDRGWTFAEALRRVRRLLTALDAPQRPTLEPGDVAGKLLGGLLDGGAAHVPWRGVEASFQWLEDDAIIKSPPGDEHWGSFAASTADNFEFWDWTQHPFDPAGFQVVCQGPSCPPPPPAAMVFTNRPFSGPPTNAPPTLNPGDHIYEVQVPQLAGERVVLIVRDAANPAHTDWYTTAQEQYLPVQPQDVSVYQGIGQVPADWPQHQWYHARQDRQ